MTLRPLRLLPSYREKIWGAAALDPWFPSSGAKIGEVWFTFDQNSTDDGQALAELMRRHGSDFFGTDRAWDSFPLLVKFIFTSECLSIQVHPDDARAGEWEGCLGKNEMWHVLRAGPDAGIALGLKEAMTRERLRESAVSGAIADLVRWFPVRAGDTFSTPPGTIHALGPGLVLVEIQQNSDVTYRLWDYGRERPLHIDKAVAVSNPEPHPGPSLPADLGGGVQSLVRSTHFATDLLEFQGSLVYRPERGRLHVLIAIEGSGTLDGREFHAGDVWVIPASAEPFPITATTQARFLRTYVPPQV